MEKLWAEDMLPKKITYTLLDCIYIYKKTSKRQKQYIPYALEN